MKTLKNHLILFDEECPMCRLYTHAFVESGLLDKEGRASYQKLPEQACPTVDRQRAANEIALINLDTGEVSYGIESLLKIFAQVAPFLSPLLKFQPFIWLMSKVYAFIAYNRRVIIPPVKDINYQFQPTFKLHYRILYLIFTWFFSSFFLSKYAELVKAVVPVGNVYREYLICGGLVIFQSIVVLFVNKKKSWDYLGNMMTIAFAGSLLLLPLVLLSVWIQLNSFFCILWFSTVAGLMLFEHMRRTRLLKLGYTLTLTGLCYCIAILLIELQG